MPAQPCGPRGGGEVAHGRAYDGRIVECVAFEVPRTGQYVRTPRILRGWDDPAGRAADGTRCSRHHRSRSRGRDKGGGGGLASDVGRLAWRIERVREDKSFPNFRTVAENVMRSIRDGVTLDELLAVVAQSPLMPPPPRPPAPALASTPSASTAAAPQTVADKKV